MHVRTVGDQRHNLVSINFPSFFEPLRLSWTSMEEITPSNNLKRKQISTETESNGAPAFKRSISFGESELTDYSESDYSIPKFGDSPPAQKQAGQ